MSNLVHTMMVHLRARAKAALASIPKEEWGEMGAVNWGDIGVCEIRHWENDHGQIGYTITLEEAAPGSKLAYVIWEKMGSLPDVEVVCEW